VDKTIAFWKMNPDSEALQCRLAKAHKH